jgi:hypothetical protein
MFQHNETGVVRDLQVPDLALPSVVVLTEFGNQFVIELAKFLCRLRRQFIKSPVHLLDDESGIRIHGEKIVVQIRLLSWNYGPKLPATRGQELAPYQTLLLPDRWI